MLNNAKTFEIQGSRPIRIKKGWSTGTARNGFAVDVGNGFDIEAGFSNGGVMSRSEAWRLILYMLPHLLFNWSHTKNSIWYGDDIPDLAEPGGGLRGKLLRFRNRRLFNKIYGQKTKTRKKSGGTIL